LNNVDIKMNFLSLLNVEINPLGLFEDQIIMIHISYLLSIIMTGIIFSFIIHTIDKKIGE